MVIFLQTVDYHEPKWQNIDSIIGKSPGLGLRPKQSQDLIDSAIIMFNKEKQAARSEEEKKKDKVPRVDEWSGRIKEFLEDYENETRVDARRKDCTFNTVDDKGKRVIKGARSDSVNEKGETQYGACHFPIAEIKKTCGPACSIEILFGNLCRINLKSFTLTIFIFLINYQIHVSHINSGSKVNMSRRDVVSSH